MISLIFSAIIFSITLCSCILLFAFSVIDIWGFLISTVPLLSTVISCFVEIKLKKRREQKILSLAKMYKLCDYLEKYINEHIKVSLNRERSGHPPLPNLSSQIDNYALKKCRPIFEEFIKLFKIKESYSTFYENFKNNFSEIKNNVVTFKKNLKLSSAEELIFKTYTQEK